MSLTGKLVAVVVGVFALGVLTGARLDAIEGPAPGAVAYMDGLQHLDGRVVWDARSRAAQDQDARELFYREHPAGTAMSEEDLIAYRAKARLAEITFYDGIRNQGGRIDHVRYYGGHATATGGVYVYETIDHRADGDLAYVWTIMTDKDGKVSIAE